MFANDARFPLAILPSVIVCLRIAFMILRTAKFLCVIHAEICVNATPALIANALCNPLSSRKVDSRQLNSPTPLIEMIQDRVPSTVQIPHPAPLFPQWGSRTPHLEISQIPRPAKPIGAPLRNGI